MARKKGPKKAAPRKAAPKGGKAKPKAPPRKAKAPARPQARSKAKARPKTARAAAAPRKAEIIAVDNGEAYNFEFPLQKKHIVRVVGKHLAPGAIVRLSSHKVQWVKFRHKAKVVHPAPHLGKGYQVILLRDTPKPRPGLAAVPPTAGGGDSGDLIITVTNTGTSATIKTNVVLYP